MYGRHLQLPEKYHKVYLRCNYRGGCCCASPGVTPWSVYTTSTGGDVGVYATAVTTRGVVNIPLFCSLYFGRGYIAYKYLPTSRIIVSTAGTRGLAPNPSSWMCHLSSNFRFYVWLLQRFKPLDYSRYFSFTVFKVQKVARNHYISCVFFHLSQLHHMYHIHMYLVHGRNSVNKRNIILGGKLENTL